MAWASALRQEDCGLSKIPAAHTAHVSKEAWGCIDVRVSGPEEGPRSSQSRKSTVPLAPGWLLNSGTDL